MQSAPAPVTVSRRGETPEELRLREMEVQRREEELSKKEEEEQRRRAEAEILKQEEKAAAEKNNAEELVRKQSELKAFLEVERAKLQQERQALSVQVALRDESASVNEQTESQLAELRRQRSDIER
eukprot:CAMPEP_0198222910 /NCGR_PEP_ID=MMETSP1445-20131203/90206_1 /TAXON_ID=36898 /ORGANISM="Pyramimonas sp., Strain CCMP2087" /LENGTH=125 /DNA_ID=CAMNT_0043901581 /DNA_START=33 /DNA_END=407 /DNA_ORIENTATION=+